ncbi:MAG: CYTH domain-containing protein [Prevotella sp.]
MSGLEIERKFLVQKSKDWKSLAKSSSYIRQGYFASVNTVRVRIRDDKGYLTIKSPSYNGGLTRYEFETEISIEDAENLLRLCEKGIIEKRRYLIDVGNHIYEVDEFYGDNEGLVLAEVELDNEDEQFEKPDFIGSEVTGDRRFYNSHMRRNPFSLWRDTLPEEYR